jgi:hypothetical protein
MSVIRKRSLRAKHYELTPRIAFGKLRQRMIPSGASSFSIGRASGWKRPGAKLPVSRLMILPSSNASFFPTYIS